MKLYWTNRCKENGFSCPSCQLVMGTKNGQMPIDSKNHKVQMLGGTIRCVVCNTVIGYLPTSTEFQGEKVRMGMSAKVLDNVDYVTPIEQEDF